MNRKHRQPLKKTPRTVAPIASCKDEVALIGDYLGGDLTLSRRSAFEFHLDICEDCLAFLETYRKTIELTRRVLRQSATHAQAT